MFEYGYLFIGVVIGVVAIYALYISFSGHGDQKRGILGWLSWGPLWPVINKYAKGRGGLSKREKIGWAVFFLITIIGILIDRLYLNR
jgi:hypothetical protein